MPGVGASDRTGSGYESRGPFTLDHSIDDGDVEIASFEFSIYRARSESDGHRGRGYVATPPGERLAGPDLMDTDRADDRSKTTDMGKITPRSFDESVS